ncbi:hypothetical protein SAEN111111_17890 [Saccharibacillus endophyticus]
MRLCVLINRLLFLFLQQSRRILIHWKKSGYLYIGLFSIKR